MLTTPDYVCHSSKHNCFTLLALSPVQTDGCSMMKHDLNIHATNIFSATILPRGCQRHVPHLTLRNLRYTNIRP